jgi:Fungal N-terminal domain of STAND proteins
MDPFSATGTAIAFAQAIDGIISLVRIVKRLRDAPGEIMLLIAEIESLQILLQDLRSCIIELGRLILIPPTRLAVLRSLAEQGNGITKELEALMKETFKGSADGKGFDVRLFDKIGWVRKEAEVRKIRKRLLELKASISVQIGSMNL